VLNPAASVKSLANHLANAGVGQRLVQPPCRLNETKGVCSTAPLGSDRFRVHIEQALGLAVGFSWRGQP